MTNWHAEYKAERARSERLLTAGQHLFDEYTKAKEKADLLDAFLAAAEHAGYAQRKADIWNPTTSTPNSGSTSTAGSDSNPNQTSSTPPQ